MIHTLRCTALGLVLISHSATSSAQTLAETVQLALAHQSDVRLAGLQVDARQANYALATAQTGWRLDAQTELGLGQVETGGAIFPESGSRQLQSFGLQLSKPLYTAGREQLGIEIAQTNIASAEAAQLNTQMQTRLQAISIHSALSRDLAIIALEQDSQQSLDRALSDANKRFKAGEVTRTDVAQARARQALGVASQSRAQADWVIAQSRYRQLTGVEPVDIPLALPKPSLQPDLDTLLAAIARSPALQAARQSVTAAEQQLRLTGLQLKPTVQLTGHAVSQKDTDFSRNRIDSYGVSLQASWPLLDGGINQAERQRALAQLSIAQAQYDSIQQQLEQKLREDYAQLTTSRDQEAALIQARDAAELALNTIRRELELGTRTTFDLLTAERDLLDTRTQLVLNQEEQSVRGYQVLADAGLLTQLP
jgi:outer membrane protein